MTTPKKKKTAPVRYVNREALWGSIARVSGRIQADTTMLYDLIVEAREREDALTWEEIGEALGVSRQAAWERFTQARRTADAARVHPDQQRML